MNAILIDYALRRNKPALDVMKCVLEKETGYSVDTCCYLSEIGLQDLGKYQLAIAHPDIESSDPFILYVEVEKRPEFKVIIRSGAIGIGLDSQEEKYGEKALSKESKQVIYTDSDLKGIIKLLKEGW